MYELPTSVTVNDTEYKIRNDGDYRMVLDCFSALNDIEMGEDYRILASLIIFYEDFDSISDIMSEDNDVVNELAHEMMVFFNCGVEDEDRDMPKLIDWETDTNIITAAINNVAGKEIRLEKYLHWWTFIGYYMSVGESVLSTVVGIRNKIIRNKKLEKWEQEYKAEHRKYFEWNSKSTEERELDNLVHELWNSGK